jgi:protein TonB
MEEKKAAKANLEYDRTTFLLLGFVVALSTLFVAFEWTGNESLSPDWSGFSPLFIEAETAALPETALEVEPSKSIETKEIKAITLVDEFNLVEEVGSEEIPNETKIEEKKETHATLNETSAVYTKADVMPQFKGGYTELVRFIYKHLEYPEMALKMRIHGRVWCSLIVKEDGTISDVQLEQGVSLYLDDEALRVLKIMPPWDPASIAGKPVRMKIYLPIVFKL